MLHRLLLSPPDGYEVDHINGNSLDNRRCNLRLCTRQQNNGNQRPRRHSSIYKGVYWNKEHQKWQAKITVNYRNIDLGRYKDEEAAAEAYAKAARRHFGEFACLPS